MRAIIFTAFLLVWCDRYLTNAEIIRATKQCEAAGLQARPYGNDLGGPITMVQCAPVPR